MCSDRCLFPRAQLYSGTTFCGVGKVIIEQDMQPALCLWAASGVSGWRGSVEGASAVDAEVETAADCCQVCTSQKVILAACTTQPELLQLVVNAQEMLREPRKPGLHQHQVAFQRSGLWQGF